MAAQRIGLLFVHGIGEQKPFEHLRASVTQLAELMGRGTATSCAVTDRTQDWTPPIGPPTAGGIAPITLTVTTGADHFVYECHEVYWADLGGRSGLFDTITFWVWGLGQWCAPIYRDIDLAQLSKTPLGQDGSTMDRPVSQIARLPPGLPGEWGTEVRARLLLSLTALGALLTLLSWSLAKRIFAFLFQADASPTIMVQYIGDVRTYEQRATPGDTPLSDPGFPRRVPIRRRMVTQMVAMGARTDLDGWFVLAHSLGTVVAYNGLTEIGHALPNYLAREQWRGLPAWLKRDPGCRLRDVGEEAVMMPARPAWLGHEDVVNRPELFRRLRGVLTYGSPLNKFAGLWPRVVATATDRQFLDDGATPEEKFVRRDANGAAYYPPSAFPATCSWYNLRTLLDPVSGDLDRFGATEGDGPARSDVPFAAFIPPIRNRTTGFFQAFLLSHLQYFRNSEPYVRSAALAQREDVARWLMDPAAVDIRSLGPVRGWQRLAAFLASVIVVVALAAATVATVAFAGGVGWSLATASSVASGLNARTFAALCAASIGPVVAATAWIVLLAGLWRWMRESRLSWRTARTMDEGGGSMRDMVRRGSFSAAVRLYLRQCIASTIVLLAATTVLLAGLAALVWQARLAAGPVPGLRGAGIVTALLGAAPVFLLAATMIQAAINLTLGKLRKLAP